MAVPKARKYSAFLPGMHRGKGADVPKSENSAWTISCLAHPPGKKEYLITLLAESPSGECQQSLEETDNRKNRP